MRTAQIEMTGTLAASWVCADAQQPEVRAGRDHARRQVHQRRVRDVAIGKDNNVDVLVADEAFHLVFFDDRNSLRVKWSRELSRITASGNVGNLVGGESDDFELGVVSKDHVEVVKVSAGRAKDEDPFHNRGKVSLDP